MRPSSFVFVAIVGLWAAHLLPQWIRRRDALGASRGGDRHSTALRVLAPRRRPRGGGRSSAPLLPGIPVVSAPVVDAPEPGPASPLAPEPGRAPAALSLAALPGASAARRRRSVLVALTGFTLLSVMGAAAGAVPAFVAVVGVLLLALDLGALRAAAVAGEHRRAAEAERSRRAAEGERARRARIAREAARAHAADETAADAEVSPGAEVEHLPGAPPAPPAARRPLADEGTWVPVPVPPPTYTLKPVAPRPAPAPLEPALAPAAAPAATVAPQLRLVEEPEVDLDSVLARRRAVNG
jgi:hypothetical protein